MMTSSYHFLLDFFCVNDVIIGVTMPKNDFFRPKSTVFESISMKIGKNIKNIKTQIYVIFDPNSPPL